MSNSSTLMTSPTTMPASPPQGCIPQRAKLTPPISSYTLPSSLIYFLRRYNGRGPPLRQHRPAYNVSSRLEYYTKLWRGSKRLLFLSLHHWLTVLFPVSRYGSHPAAYALLLINFMVADTVIPSQEQASDFMAV